MVGHEVVDTGDVSRARPAFEGVGFVQRVVHDVRGFGLAQPPRVHRPQRGQSDPAGKGHLDEPRTMLSEVPAGDPLVRRDRRDTERRIRIELPDEFGQVARDSSPRMSQKCFAVVHDSDRHPARITARCW